GRGGARGARGGRDPARRGARPLLDRALHELPGADEAERSLAGAARRDLRPHRLRDRAHRAVARDRLTDPGPRHRRGRAAPLRRTPMRKRMIQTVMVLLVLVGGLGPLKFMQIRTAMAQGAAWQPPPEAVSTTVAHVEDWSSSLNAIGSVA